MAQFHQVIIQRNMQKYDYMVLNKSILEVGQMNILQVGIILMTMSSKILLMKKFIVINQMVVNILIYYFIGRKIEIFVIVSKFKNSNEYHLISYINIIGMYAAI